MSSPTISMLSMGHIASHGGARETKVTLGVAGRRSSTSSDAGMPRRGSGGSDTGSRRSSGGEDGGGGGGGGRRVGVVHFDEDKNCVFTSSSYAASRGLQRSSPSRPISGIDLTHPVAPPRAKGMTTAAASLLSSLTSVGIKKSSSDVIIPTPMSPSKGILKSSSGILKTNHPGVPVSNSPSAGNLSTSSRVNFSDYVNDAKNAASSPPSASEPPSGMSVKSFSSTTVSSSSFSSKVAATPDKRKTAMNAVGTAPATASTVVSSSQITISSSHSTFTSSSVVTDGISSRLPTSKPPNSPPSPPPVAPPRTRAHQSSSSGRGPTGRTLTRQAEVDIPAQEPPSRKKADTSPHPIHYPKAQYPQQKETQQKGTQHPQPKESLPQLQQKGTQHPQRRDSDKTHALQQQVKVLQQRETGINDKRLNSHPGEDGAHENLSLRQQQQRDLEKQELLRQQQQHSKQKKQQKTPNVNIPDAKQRIEEEYQRDQQLIRAGSLGSGEPAAILHQRSRSPLPSPDRKGFDVSNKQIIPPIVVVANSSPQIVRKDFTTSEITTNAERTKATDKINNNIAGRKVEVGESAPKAGTGNNAAPITGSAAVETRTGVIRAAAKAYTENFQTYSYSSYLTKTRKDSVPAKETSILSKESQESPTEINSSSANSSNQSPSSTSTGSVTPPITSYNNTPRPFSRSTAGKIIVPLEPFAVASTNKGHSLTNEVPSNKLSSFADKVIPTNKTNKTEINSVHLDQKPLASKPDITVVKQTTGSTSNTQEQQNSQDRAPAKVTPAPKESVKISREKAISSCNTSVPSGSTNSTSAVKNNHTNTPAPPSNRKNTRTLPPILTSLRFSSGDKMKGSSEGALLVACRVAEEDQVIRLLKELTATGALDATTLNQTDRSGRTSLSYACANAFLRVVESLTSMQGLDINKPDTDGNTPLHYAAQAGHTEIVSHLVNKCNRTVDLDARNALGFTPLMKAALQGRTKIAKILLFAGASPHLRDFGRGLCAVEWARYTGRHICSELIDSVQKSCSSHIRDRWTSDPDLKSHSSTSINTLGQGDNKESWIKHKIKKAFHKSESKKEFSVVTNLSTMAVCATSPLLPTAVSQQDVKPHQVVVPHVQITEVKVPDCYEDPEDALSRLPPPPPPPVLPPEEAGGSSPKSPKKQSKNAAATTTTTSTSTATPSSSTSASASASASCSTSAAATETSSTSAEEEIRGETGDSKTNGTAKSIVSSSKLPFSSTKKRK